MRLFGTMMSVALLGLLAQTAQANGDCAAASDAGCCDPCASACCGDGCCNGKRCELKVGKKKIKVVCYGCECDAVCLPGPSRPGCKHCESTCADCCDSCGGCGSCDKCASDCDHKPNCKVRWQDWCASECANLYHRKKLVKYEYEKEVPDYKWVVVDCGAPCGDGAAPAPAPAGRDAPPLPPVPKPASFSKNRNAVTKPAPKNARSGQMIPLTDAEIRQVEQQIRQVSHTAPVAAQPTATKPVVRTSARDAAPWGLFGN